MCRMFVAKNITSVLTTEELKSFFLQLNNSQGGGGWGVSFVDSSSGKARVRYGKCGAIGNYMAQSQMQSAVWDLFNLGLTMGDKDKPIVLHVRGPRGEAYLSHPHQLDLFTTPQIMFNKSLLASSELGTVVHNGDTRNATLNAMLKDLNVDFNNFRKNGWIAQEQKEHPIDTQVIANYLREKGFGEFAKLMGEGKYTGVGSIIQQKVNGIKILRGQSGTEDYTKLYLMVWDNGAWMVASEPPRSMKHQPEFMKEIKHGAYDIEELLERKEKFFVEGVIAVEPVIDVDASLQQILDEVNAHLARVRRK